MDTQRVSQFRPVLISCPHWQRSIPGLYACGVEGDYLRGDRGQFLLCHTRCGQLQGRCAQMLCALHRMNRRGAGTWFPERIHPLASAPPTGAGTSSDAPTVPAVGSTISCTA